MAHKVAFRCTMTYEAVMDDDEWDDFRARADLPPTATAEDVMRVCTQSSGQFALDNLASEGHWTGHGIYYLTAVSEVPDADPNRS